MEFLRSEETQAWIGTFGKGKFDNQALFYRVTVPAQRAGEVGLRPDRYVGSGEFPESSPLWDRLLRGGDEGS